MARYARRLQKIGSSIMISLPSGWARGNGLKKGNTVILETNKDNSLSIFSSGHEIDQAMSVSIPYPPVSMDALVNQVYGAYLLGYDIIRIKGKSQISFEDAERIKHAMRKLAGLEIIDEDGANISVQFLLDAGTHDAEKILRRMSSIVAGMYRETLEAIKNPETGLGKIITSRDDEVDRQYFLLVRLIRSAMMNPRLASKLNLSNIDILDYRIAANHLESAGDYVVDLTEAIPKTSARFADSILEAGSLVERMQEKSVTAFVNKNRSESQTITSMYLRFNQILESIKEMSAKGETKDPVTTVSVLNCIYSMDKIARCWVDVFDLVKPVYLIAPLVSEKPTER